MTRTLFFFTALAAMLAALTAVLIRVELAHPGLSPLFQPVQSDPNTANFALTGVAHISFAYLAATLLGTTACSAAHTKHAPMAAGCAILGCILSFIVFALTALTLLPPLPEPGADTGWLFSNPYSASMPQTLLSDLLAMLRFGAPLTPDPSNLTQFFFLPAAFMTLLGVYAMLATLPAFRLLTPIGFILLTPITLLAASILATQTPILLEMLYLGATLPLLAFAAIRLIDSAPSWLMTLAIGLIATTIGAAILVLISIDTLDAETLLDSSLRYTFPLGLSFFLLPALILYDRNTDLPPWGTALALCAITLPLTLWISKIADLGLSAIPPLHLDAGNFHTPNTLLLSVNVFLFIAFYLGTLTAVRRATK